MVLNLAMVCWNLPVAESSNDPEWPNTRKLFDEAMAHVPEPVGRVLRGLIEDRKTRFAAVPFFVNVRVEGKSLKSARIFAEARMPRTPAVRH